MNGVKESLSNSLQGAEQNSELEETTLIGWDNAVVQQWRKQHMKTEVMAAETL